MSRTKTEFRALAVRVRGEVRAGDNLAKVLLSGMEESEVTLQAGDVLVVKHKVVSKAEGRLVKLETVRPSAASRTWAKRYDLDARVTELALRESKRVVRRKRGVLITETRHGWVCANSGVDVSNVDGGTHALLLPEDADQSAAKLRRDIKRLTGIAVAVIISDSFGRAWREGLTEAAIGVAGMKPLDDLRGRRDRHGYRLRVSLEAVADELAGVAGLLCGKLKQTPACVVRGFAYPAGQGRATELVRAAAFDLFR